MKKIYKLKLLILCCYLLLSASYSYGMIRPIISTTKSVASPTPLLLSLCGLIQRGNAYHDQNNYLTAIATYNDALQKYGQHYREKSILLSMIYHKLGVSYLAIKRYPQSYDYLQQTLTIRKTFLSIAISSDNKINSKAISQITGESHHHLGCLYLAMDQPREAIMSFKAALATEWQHHEKSIETRCFLAKAYQGQKGFGKAILQPELNLIRNQELGIRNYLRPFACPICKKKFAQKQNMKTHMRSHTGKKPFACPVCKKKFVRKWTVKTHMRVHTGEKPFACPFCKRKFSQKYNLKKHINALHPITSVSARSHAT